MTDTLPHGLTLSEDWFSQSAQFWTVYDETGRAVGTVSRPRVIGGGKWCVYRAVDGASYETAMRPSRAMVSRFLRPAAEVPAAEAPAAEVPAAEAPAAEAPAAEKPLPQRVAADCVAYLAPQGLKGKARDRAAYDYFAGASQTLRLIGRIEEADWLARVLVYLIAPRGFREVEAMASK